MSIYLVILMVVMNVDLISFEMTGYFIVLKDEMMADQKISQLVHYYIVLVAVKRDVLLVL